VNHNYRRILGRRILGVGRCSFALRLPFELPLRSNDESERRVAQVVLTLCVPAMGATASGKRSEQLRRGEYPADFGGCNDGHRPKVTSLQGPVPDPSRLLSGHSQTRRCRRSRPVR
jgi:hypothetical protein